MKKIVLSALYIFSAIALYATHNKAGEITYKHIAGYMYKITVTTYTKESSKLADRCSLNVHFGDGDTSVFTRVNGTLGILCGGSIPEGQSVGDDVKKNIYEGLHTFPGPGTFKITMNDPNRNGNICNIAGPSDQISFFLQTVLIITPFLPPNTSPVLLTSPIDKGCIGECFSHNPAAYDEDGDSLYYRLVPCSGNGHPIPGYTFPNGMTEESIDHTKGRLEWCSAATACQYNIAILIEEWKYSGGKRYFVGSVLRDMEITISACSNKAPKLDIVKDTFVVAKDTLRFSVKSSDPNPDKLTMTGSGGPFENTPKASFVSLPATQMSTGDFKWVPDCFEVQRYPYQVIIKVQDDNPNYQLTDYTSVFIRVIAPAVKDFSVSQLYKASELHWKQPLCNDTTWKNRLIGYDIYRKENCDNWEHQPGETGVPASAGYKLIASVNEHTMKYIDDNNGLGLTVGTQYTYIIVVRYYDGAESYASEGKCTTVTSINELDPSTSIEIFPNPSAGTFTVTSDFYSNSRVTLSIKNSLGQLVYKSNTIFGNAGETIFVRLQSGIYFLEITNGKERSLRKIVIQE